MDKIIDGTALAKKHEEALKKKIAGLAQKPHIVSLLIGDNAGSILYSNLKQKKAGEVGIEFDLKKFPDDVSWEKIVSEIENLNDDVSIHGVMIQLPLPEKFLEGHQTQDLIDKINPAKDVDGLTGKGPLGQAAVRGILSILESEKVDLKTIKVVVVGARGMVGSELVKRLEELGTRLVGKVEKEAENPCEIEKQADVLISVVGKKNLITAECVKPGAVVIDVGGDVDFENVKDIASRITPPRGGVGPMTVISLMENALDLV